MDPLVPLLCFHAGLVGLNAAQEGPGGGPHLNLGRRMDAWIDCYRAIMGVCINAQVRHDLHGNGAVYSFGYPLLHFAAWLG